MVNFNGDLISENDVKITVQNRAFKYGDAIFETIKFKNNRLIFFEDHYFRLMASMRMLRMKIPMSFTLEFLEQEILKIIPTENAESSYRVRFSVFRKDGGLYAPKSNSVSYLIEAHPNTYQTKATYTIDLYKDFYNYSGLLSTVKTTNKMLHVLASVFMQENDLDNCILLNERKGVAEAINANIFIVNGTEIKTPALTEGCVKGIVRKKVIEIIQQNPNYSFKEAAISPFEVQKADEVFITNAIIGIQPITNYRKKTFQVAVANQLQNSLKLLEITQK